MATDPRLCRALESTQTCMIEQRNADRWHLPGISQLPIELSDVRRSRPQAFPDVVPINPKASAITVLPAQQNMAMRKLGIPVSRGDPIQLFPQIELHLHHELADIPFHIQAVPWRHNDGPGPRVALAAIHERLAVDGVSLTGKELRPLAILTRAVPTDVAAVPLRRGGAITGRARCAITLDILGVSFHPSGPHIAHLDDRRDARPWRRRVSQGRELHPGPWALATAETHMQGLIRVDEASPWHPGTLLP